MNSLFTQTFYDNNSQTYKNIYVVDQKPQGPLEAFARRIHTPKLSPFKQNDNTYESCVYAIYNPQNPTQLLCIEEISIHSC